MIISFGGKTLNSDQSQLLDRKNKFPDILFFSAGKVSNVGKSSKFKIKLLLGKKVIKTWSETVKYSESDGTSFGNVFSPFLFTSDDVSDFFDFVIEIDGKIIEPSDAEGLAVGETQTVIVPFDDQNGNRGSIGLTAML